MLQLWFFANSILWPFDVGISGFHLRLNVILLSLVGVVWIWKRRRITNYSAKILFFLFVGLLFSYLGTISGVCTGQFQKSILTAPILFVLVLIGLEVGWRAVDNDWLKLQETAVWVLLIAFAGFIIEALFPASFPNQAAYRFDGKLSGWFNEPSHVAFSLLPSIAILLVAERKNLRIFGVLALLGLFVLSRSSTLIALIFVWGLYRLFITRRPARSLALGFGLLLVVGLAAIQNYDKFVAPTLLRFGGVIAMDEATNMSSLVYVQGWQDAWANLQRTNGLGLGFNMMGCTPLPDVPARAILTNTYKHPVLNSEDGSILISKLVSETGVIGILFFVGIIWWWIRVENHFRKYCTGVETSVIAIQIALMFSFVATSLIRSSGYFNGGVLLLLVAVAATVKWHRAYNKTFAYRNR